jgi:hypothetical protein
MWLVSEPVSFVAEDWMKTVGLFQALHIIWFQMNVNGLDQLF